MSKYDKYKESAFTHEEMQPMIIETDMTDIVERLREETDELTDALEMIIAENRKMREALREIIKLDDEWKPETLDDYSGVAYEHCGNIARAALGEEET